MVEHAAVNRRVAGSSPARGAKLWIYDPELFSLWDISFTSSIPIHQTDTISDHPKIQSGG